MSELNDQMLHRRQELTELRAAGIEPYAYDFHRDALASEILAGFRDETPRRIVRVAGRIVAIRKMGKASFMHILDSSGKLQIYIKKDDVGELYESLKLFDIGDIIGVKGYVFRTKMGEVSVHSQEVTMLAKSLRPLPTPKEETDVAGNKVVHDAFSDKELRYRQRYLDLIVNPGVRDTFRKRSEIVRSIRRFLDSKGYLEVETPALQPLYGGAYARPFVTHHNALDIDLYMRIADELYLKRLIVGGFDAVYEIAKDFRNEGMDKNHNPEFTMLELYVAYKDYEWMMKLVEEMIAIICKAVLGTTKVKVGENEIDFTPPFKRITMLDVIKEHTGKDLNGMDEKTMLAAARALGVDVESNAGEGKIIDEIFSECVESKLIQPTFIIDYPLSMSPLAKKHRTKKGLVERFELMANGQELANAFSELNDPIDQRERFEEQARLRSRGDDEAMQLDEDFLRSLEFGMPPTAGMGMGIDRLTMILTGEESIRDVILFPQMKPETNS